MDKNIETYVKQIVSGLHCSKEEKNDIAEEMKSHLYLLKNEYRAQGLASEEASQKALQDFGDESNIKAGLQNSIFPHYKIFQIGTWILFGLYSFIILGNLLIFRLINVVRDGFNPYFGFFKEYISFFDPEVWRINANFIPFQNISMYIVEHYRFNLDIIIHNLFGNIIIFIPLGLFLPILFKKYRSFSSIIAGGILISFTVEALQFFLQVGQFDIDDVILNTVGCIIGYFIIKLIIKVLQFTRWDISQISG